jgi:hypothetical protein
MRRSIWVVYNIAEPRIALDNASQPIHSHCLEFHSITSDDISDNHLGGHCAALRSEVINSIVSPVQSKPWHNDLLEL